MPVRTFQPTQVSRHALDHCSFFRPEGSWSITSYYSLLFDFYNWDSCLYSLSLFFLFCFAPLRFLGAAKVCTQPRRLAALTLSQLEAKEESPDSLQA